MQPSAQQQLNEIQMSASEIIAMRDEHDRQERARLTGFIVGFTLVITAAIYFTRFMPASLMEWLGLN